MKNEQINDLAYAALDAACASIQDALGVKTGDFAGMYFSGERHDAIIAILADYIGAEISEGMQS